MFSVTRGHVPIHHRDIPPVKQRSIWIGGVIRLMNVFLKLCPKKRCGDVFIAYDTAKKARSYVLGLCNERKFFQM